MGLRISSLILGRPPQRLGFPSRPNPPQARPEQAVQALQCRSWPLAFQLSQLLTQSQDFQKSLYATSEEYADSRQKGEGQVKRE